MNNILKVLFVIIGTIIGAGFASRKRNILILWNIWHKWNNRNNNFTNNYWNNNI